MLLSLSPAYDDQSVWAQESSQRHMVPQASNQSVPGSCETEIDEKADLLANGCPHGRRYHNAAADIFFMGAHCVDRKRQARLIVLRVWK